MRAPQQLHEISLSQCWCHLAQRFCFAMGWPLLHFMPLRPAPRGSVRDSPPLLWISDGVPVDLPPATTTPSGKISCSSARTSPSASMTSRQASTSRRSLTMPRICRLCGEPSLLWRAARKWSSAALGSNFAMASLSPFMAVKPFCNLEKMSWASVGSSPGGCCASLEIKVSRAGAREENQSKRPPSRVGRSCDPLPRAFLRTSLTSAGAVSGRGAGNS
mmetsp:Transcript_78927/g.235241  ORF Transcript_78927/g.235241 Transcript_78927/m.235241 type:complete len:218 (-) Transcript_78927:1043-1696(-)